jgi:hypothetical protein
MAKREFVQNFNKVARFYRLEELGEIEEAKECARRDMEAAEVCYAAIAREIEEGWL